MRVFCLFFAVFAMTTASPQGFCQSAPPQAGQQSPTLGWLEGTILTNNGQIVSGFAYSPGSKHLHGVRHGGGEFDAQTNEKMGGLYSVPNLRPGVYDISVERGYVGGTAYAPQRIFGIVVKPGTRTMLNIVMNQGEQVEEVGSPVVATNTVIPLSVELAQLRQQVADLKQQMEVLKKQLAEMQTGTSAAGTKGNQAQ